jgi:thioredoxin-related protein
MRITAAATILSLILLISLSGNNFAEASPKAIKWYTYTDGLAAATQQNKKILIIFSANWCGFCKKMNKETFANKAVMDYIDENIIPVKVDAEAEKKLVSQYAISALPSHVFLSETGNSLGTLTGFIEATKFLSVLKYINGNDNNPLSLEKYFKSL